MGKTEAGRSGYGILLYEATRDALARLQQPNRQSRDSAFPSDHMEALTYFHGPLFALFCQAMDREPEDFWAEHHIPPAGETCRCYSCTVDALAEAQTLVALGDDDERRHRFRVGARHQILWKGDHIHTIYPDGPGETLTAKQYLKAKTHEHTHNLRAVGRSLSAGIHHLETR